MRPFELPPRDEGEAEGLPRLIPDLQLWEEAETEGAPRPTPGSAGQTQLNPFARGAHS